jgi:thioesterase domain-containing protein
VENIARQYVKEIRSVQTRGPYCVGGYSFGALIAYEVAQQLKSHCHEVSLLVLLDPYLPKSASYKPSMCASSPTVPQTAARSRRNINRHVQNLLALDGRQQFSYILERVIGTIEHISVGLSSRIKLFLRGVVWTLCVRFGWRLPLSIRIPCMLQMYRRATRRYVPTTYDGPVLVFACEGTIRDDQWRTLFHAGVQFETVTGVHSNVIKEPHVKTWAVKLGAALEQAHKCAPSQ